ncbi:hypothetical protein E2C01_021712 [Portunus trituberculatus]|uniref:Uncharacterized protein n=1 Tax=Portunus trituberculatus TaxID=210409 RepID=A0A5B7E5N1_PORTR|nr:hypothetical protein [Portunus trituberculatus]
MVNNPIFRIKSIRKIKKKTRKMKENKDYKVKRSQQKLIEGKYHKMTNLVRLSTRHSHLHGRHQSQLVCSHLPLAVEMIPTPKQSREKSHSKQTTWIQFQEHEHTGTLGRVEHWATGGQGSTPSHSGLRSQKCTSSCAVCYSCTGTDILPRVNPL